MWELMGNRTIDEDHHTLRFQPSMWEVTFLVIIYYHSLICVGFTAFGWILTLLVKKINKLRTQEEGGS